MSGFSNQEGIVIVENMIKVIQDNKDYLSEIDGAIGDGDHGINMNKGFTKTAEQIKNKNLNLAEGMETLGTVLFSEIGGSMGPLYGMFFKRMSMVIKNKEEITKEDFAEMLHAAREGIQELGDAKVGDKTLMDTLVPAIEAFDKALEEGKEFVKALEDMQMAAEKGKNSTKDLVAKIGRASRLGERSRGVLDAGATSCNLLLQSMANTIKTLI